MCMYYVCGSSPTQYAKAADRSLSRERGLTNKQMNTCVYIYIYIYIYICL